MSRKRGNADLPPSVERAAASLSGWSGTGVDWGQRSDPVRLANRQDTIADSRLPEYAYATQWRGGVMTKHKSTPYPVELPSQKFKRLRTWKKNTMLAVVPRQRSLSLQAGALSFANLPRPLEDWLLVVVAHEWSRWPNVRRFALLCLPDPVAIDDAAQCVVFRTAELAQDNRAKALGIRADDYRKRRKRAIAMLENWLDRAARGYLEGLGTDAIAQDD